MPYKKKLKLFFRFLTIYGIRAYKSSIMYWTLKFYRHRYKIKFLSYIHPCAYTLTWIFVFHDVDKNKEFEIAIEQDNTWKLQTYWGLYSASWPIQTFFILLTSSVWEAQNPYSCTSQPLLPTARSFHILKDMPILTYLAMFRSHQLPTSIGDLCICYNIFIR